MEKRFRDLKKGDSVFIIDNEEVVETKVKNTRENRYGQFYVYTTYYYNWPYCGYPGSKRSGCLFVNEEEAYKHLRKILEKRKIKLEKKINSLVSEFDLLDRINPPTVKPSTKSPSMKELKPGESVWWVDKEKVRVEKVKVKKIRKFISFHSRKMMSSLQFITSDHAFIAFPGSTRSTNLVYYTTEEQAWRYMLEWRKSRMKTVGNEMEKLMKELEKIERNEE